jgi:hypothetical protein
MVSFITRDKTNLLIKLNPKQMKNLKFILLLLVSLSIITISCNKSDDPTEPDNPITGYQGGFNINLNGTTYNKLKSDVVEMEEGVTFLVDNNKGGQFQIAIPNIPAVGATATIILDAPEDATMVLVAQNPIEGYATLIGGAGTVTRESADKYTLDVTLYGGATFGDHFPMSGTITVGKHGAK